jgi:hypothetical protein
MTLRDHNRAWALRLAEAGISVFPTNPDPESKSFKKSVISDWDGNSSCDLEVVAQMWANCPGAMPAIDLRKCGLVVLDGDRHGGPDGREGLRELLQPNTKKTTDPHRETSRANPTGGTPVFAKDPMPQQR